MMLKSSVVASAAFMKLLNGVCGASRPPSAIHKPNPALGGGYLSQGSKDPNNRALGPKYCGIWDLKPYYLGSWTLRVRFARPKRLSADQHGKLRNT